MICSLGFIPIFFATISDCSPAQFIVNLVSTSRLIWLVYGIMIESVAMILANIAALSCIFAIIAGVLKLRREE